MHLSYLPREPCLPPPRRFHPPSPQDLRELNTDPSPLYTAAPLADSLFEWHFTIRGPPGTEFDGGIYHGRILLPPDYPFKPPNIIFLTETGRWESNKKICLSISAHHPESWSPAWGIRLMLEAIISFMPSAGEGALAALDYTPAERAAIARRSAAWSCPHCGPIAGLLRAPVEAGAGAGAGAEAPAAAAGAGGPSARYAAEIARMHLLPAPPSPAMAPVPASAEAEEAAAGGGLAGRLARGPRAAAEEAAAAQGARARAGSGAQSPGGPGAQSPGGPGALAGAVAAPPPLAGGDAGARAEAPPAGAPPALDATSALRRRLAYASAREALPGRRQLIPEVVGPAAAAAAATAAPPPPPPPVAPAGVPPLRPPPAAAPPLLHTPPPPPPPPPPSRPRGDALLTALANALTAILALLLYRRLCEAQV